MVEWKQAGIVYGVELFIFSSSILISIYLPDLASVGGSFDARRDRFPWRGGR